MTFDFVILDISSSSYICFLWLVLQPQFAIHLSCKWYQSFPPNGLVYLCKEAESLQQLLYQTIRNLGSDLFLVILG